MPSEAIEGEGYTKITVRSARSEDYQTEAREAEYVFGRQVTPAELRVAEQDAAELMAELAESALREAIGQKQAGELAAVKAPDAPDEPAEQADTPAIPTGNAPEEETSDTPITKQHRLPNGQGTRRYPARAYMSEQELVDAVKASIEESGADPDFHFVYDERENIEGDGYYDPGVGWNFCNVKPTEQNPIYDEMLNDKGYPKKSFFVNYDQESGDVYVKASDEYRDAAVRAAGL